MLPNCNCRRCNKREEKVGCKISRNTQLEARVSIATWLWRVFIFATYHVRQDIYIPSPSLKLFFPLVTAICELFINVRLDRGQKRLKKFGKCNGQPTAIKVIRVVFFSSDFFASSSFQRKLQGFGESHSFFLFKQLVHIHKSVVGTKEIPLYFIFLDAMCRDTLLQQMVRIVECAILTKKQLDRVSIFYFLSFYKSDKV